MNPHDDFDRHDTDSGHDDSCESELTSHGHTPCRCEARAAFNAKVRHVATDYEIVEAMIDFGGSFAVRWGMLYRSADASNQARLKAAFPDVWSRYEELVKARARQESQR